MRAAKGAGLTQAVKTTARAFDKSAERFAHRQRWFTTTRKASHEWSKKGEGAENLRPTLQDEGFRWLHRATATEKVTYRAHMSGTWIEFKVWPWETDLETAARAQAYEMYGVYTADWVIYEITKVETEDEDSE
jgi:hypothetical protein